MSCATIRFIRNMAYERTLIWDITLPMNVLDDLIVVKNGNHNEIATGGMDKNTTFE